MPSSRAKAAAPEVRSYRGSGNGRPSGLPLPPEAMPLRRARRVLKRWRYVGVYGSELSLCVGAVRVGPFRQSFWAVWDRAAGKFHERTVRRAGGVRLQPGLVTVHDDSVDIDLRLEEGRGVEVVTPYGRGYVWTRKQAGVAARGSLTVDGNRRELECPAFIDDWAGYPPRRTSWLWSAGVGTDIEGRAIDWNLVTGINDRETNSERTIWIDSHPREVEPVTFAPDLTAIKFADGAELRFAPEAVRRREDNLLLIRSSYEQPFGVFSGRLCGGIELREGFGVMERHAAVW
jgi:Protein of unknown function (DUF2804)